MIKVRPVCGGLAEAMDNVKDYETLDDFVKYMSNESVLSRYTKVCKDKFTTEFYGYDARINWETWIILYDGRPVAYANGELK